VFYAGYKRSKICCQFWPTGPRKTTFVCCASLFSKRLSIVKIFFHTDKMPSTTLTSPICKNQKSKNNPNAQCTNPASHGMYCGHHYKNPRPYVDAQPDESCVVQKIQKWFRAAIGPHRVRTQGPAYFDRALCVNDEDFFSMDSLHTLESTYFFSFLDVDKHFYGFDIRSIYTLVHRATQAREDPVNPYTRNNLTIHTIQNVRKRARWLQQRNLPIAWEPLTPPTPEQQTTMHIVDLFTKIDELNYYSSPNWFLNLDVHGHQRFYKELFAIWNHRAGLSSVQKNTIVPNHAAELFRLPLWSVHHQPLPTMRAINMKHIEKFITSADDRNDRILGAMYIMSTMTIVSNEARAAYPWLYESVAEGGAGDLLFAEPFGTMFGIRWLQEMLTIAGQRDSPMPPLLLGPARMYEFDDE
jgi:hypothetical protein